MDKKLKEGIDLFNKGKYYACHDVLEELWKETNNEYNNFYKGLIHVAVAMYLLEQNRLPGAIKRFSSAISLLEPYVAEKPFGLALDSLTLNMNTSLSDLEKRVVSGKYQTSRQDLKVDLVISIVQKENHR